MYLGLNPEAFRFAAPTENVDGTPVKGPLNYNVYRSSMSSSHQLSDLFFTTVGVLQEDGFYSVPTGDFPPGHHYVVMTAVDTEGDESVFSNEISFYISDGVAPRPPVLVD